MSDQPSSKKEDDNDQEPSKSQKPVCCSLPHSVPYKADSWEEINPIELHLPKPINLTLIGQSIAGCRSCITIPEFGMVFDYGLNPLVATLQPMVAITHGHADHMGALHFHAFERRMHRMGDPTYLMPLECMENFNAAYESYKKLNRHGKIFVSKTYMIEPINRRELNNDLSKQVAIKAPKGKYIVKAFATPHTVPSVGYIVYDVRKKLLPQYQSLTGKEIGKLVKTGVEVSKTVEIPIFGYTGDTKIEGILGNPEFLECEVLMTECSYIGKEDDEEDTVAKCRARGHIHMDEIRKNAEKFKNTYLILCHFSRRYKKLEIQSKVEKLNQEFGTKTKTNVLAFL